MPERSLTRRNPNPLGAPIGWPLRISTALPGVPPRVLLRWGRVLAWLLGFCAAQVVATAQGLPNGVKTAVLRPNLDIPYVIVPAGRASLRLEASDYRILMANAIGGASDVTGGWPVALYVKRSTSPTPPSEINYDYVRTYNGPWPVVVDIANPPAGTYYVRLLLRDSVSGVLVWIDAYSLTATHAPPRPTITVQPQGRAVKMGDAVRFDVSATGESLTYQWQKDGGNLAGATSASYPLASVQTGQAGKYRVVVSNPGGSVQSNEADLTVLVPPSITAQPREQKVMPGGTATFTVTAAGSTPLTYQWLRNGTALAGATSATFTLTHVRLDQDGAYTVQVANGAGSVVSSAAPLIVGPAITVPPRDLSVPAGNSATFGVTATGTAPLNFQWFRGATALAGQTRTNLTLDNVQSSDAGSYKVEVSNPAGKVTSANVTLTVQNAPTAPTIAVEPRSQTVTEGESATFSVQATGTAPLGYQWFFTAAGPALAGRATLLGSPGAISGATGPTLMRSPVTAADAGDYWVEVRNTTGSTTSAKARLTVDPGPRITLQPQDLLVPPGATASFVGAAVGRAPLTYQWRFNGEALPGETEARLVRTNVTLAQAGLYQLVVSNAAAVALTQSARLTVRSVDPSLGTLIWTADVPSDFPPALGADGTLFIAQDGLRALNSDGTERWRFAGGGRATLGGDGSVFTFNTTTLYALQPDGAVRWTLETRTDATAGLLEIRTLALGPRGQILVAGSRNDGAGPSPAICEVGSDGTVVRVFDAGNGDAVLALVVASEGVLITRNGVRAPVASATSLHAFDPTGTGRWTHAAPALDLFEFCALGPGGQVYIGVHDRVTEGTVTYWRTPHLMAVGATGVHLWDSVTTAGRFATAVGAEGSIYVGGGGELLALHPDGSLRWKLKPPGSGTADRVTLPALAVDGLIYVGAGTNLHAVDETGRVQWTYEAGESVRSAPTLDSNGTVYFSTTRKLHAVRGGAPLVDGAWACFGGDARQTFRIASATLPPMRHTADFRNPPGKIDGTELNAVLALWRVGSYHADAAVPGGFAPGPGLLTGPRHAADFREPYGKIDSTEINRVLSYWRAGAYHTDIATPDGFAAGDVP